jgi:hypothetical protein
LDKKFVKFYNGMLTRLSKSNAELLFDSLFESLFSESNKSASNHGYKIVIQLLVKNSANLLNLDNLTKVRHELFI